VFSLRGSVSGNSSSPRSIDTLVSTLSTIIALILTPGRRCRKVISRTVFIPHCTVGLRPFLFLPKTRTAKCSLYLNPPAAPYFLGIDKSLRVFPLIGKTQPPPSVNPPSLRLPPGPSPPPANLSSFPPSPQVIIWTMNKSPRT